MITFCVINVKEIHNKVQTNTQHQIVDLKIPFQDVEQKVILDNIKCDEHQTKMICLFCRTCDHLVCTDCISSNHNKHNFEPVEKIFSEKLDELKGAEARYCKDLTLCRSYHTAPNIALIRSYESYIA